MDNDEVLESPLCELTEPLALLILSLLPPRDRVRCSALSTHYRALVASPELWQHLRVERGWGARMLEGVLTYARASLRTVDVQTTRVGDLKLLLKLLRPAKELQTLSFAFPARLVQSAACREDFWPLAALLRGVAGDAEQAGRVALALGSLYSQAVVKREDESAATGIHLVHEIFAVLRRHSLDLACARSCLETLSESALFQSQLCSHLSRSAVAASTALVCDVLALHLESRRVQLAGLRLLHYSLFYALHESKGLALRRLVNRLPAPEADSPLRRSPLRSRPPPPVYGTNHLPNPAAQKRVRQLLALNALYGRCADAALAALRRHVGGDRASAYALDQADAPAFFPEGEEDEAEPPVVVDVDAAAEAEEVEVEAAEAGGAAEEEIAGEAAQPAAEASRLAFQDGCTCGAALDLLHAYVTSFPEEPLKELRPLCLDLGEEVEGVKEAAAASARRAQRCSSTLSLTRRAVLAHPLSSPVQRAACSLMAAFQSRVNECAFPAAQFLEDTGGAPNHPWFLSGAWELARGQLQESLDADSSRVYLSALALGSILMDDSVGPQLADTLLALVWDGLSEGLLRHFPTLASFKASACIRQLQLLSRRLLAHAFAAAEAHPPNAPALAAILEELPEPVYVGLTDSEHEIRRSGRDTCAAMARNQRRLDRFLLLCTRRTQPPLVYALLRFALSAASLAALGFPEAEAGPAESRSPDERFTWTALLTDVSFFPFAAARVSPDFGVGAGVPAALLRLAGHKGYAQKTILELLGYGGEMSEGQREAASGAAVNAAEFGAVSFLSTLMWENLSDFTDAPLPEGCIKEEDRYDNSGSDLSAKIGLAAAASLDSLALALRPLGHRTAAAAELIARAARAYAYPGGGMLQKVEHAAALIGEAGELSRLLKELQADLEAADSVLWDVGALDHAASWIAGLEERAAEARTEAAAALKVLEKLSLGQESAPIQ